MESFFICSAFALDKDRKRFHKSCNARILIHLKSLKTDSNKIKKLDKRPNNNTRNVIIQNSFKQSKVRKSNREINIDQMIKSEIGIYLLFFIMSHIVYF